MTRRHDGSAQKAVAGKTGQVGWMHWRAITRRRTSSSFGNTSHRAGPCCQVMRSRIEPMKTIARTQRSHRALILNYFRANLPEPGVAQRFF